MKVIFIGSVKFSLATLKELYRMGINIVGVCTKESSIFNSDHSDLSEFCDENDIPWIYSRDINSPLIVSWIKSKQPDLMFCFGWSQLLSQDVLQIPQFGVIGFHPTLLPKNRGRHPIIWTLVLGLEETGSTFFWMCPQADSGDIISQSVIKVELDDDASTLYDKIQDMAIIQLREFIPLLQRNEIKPIRQDLEAGNVWRKRSKTDGEIDWRMSAQNVKNLVRGLTRPYLGAHFVHQDREFKVWNVRVISIEDQNLEPGKIIGINGKHLIVKCGENAVVILESDPAVSLKIGDYL